MKPKNRMSARAIPAPRPVSCDHVPTAMWSFRIDEKRKSMLEASARAANCTMTEMVLYLIESYHATHIANLPKPNERE